MTWGLPTSVVVSGKEYEIRSDYRAVLDICAAVEDPELNNEERSAAVLSIFYPEAESLPPENWREAIEKCFWFINGGEEQPAPHRSPRLVDWEQDFLYICGPVNRVIGQEVRSVEYMHWWTFLSAYMEIGDCTFAQIVRIRDKLSRGKALDKQERAWYRQNRNLVDFKRKYNQTDQNLLKEWSGV